MENSHPFIQTDSRQIPKVKNNLVTHKLCYKSQKVIYDVLKQCVAVVLFPFSLFGLLRLQLHAPSHLALLSSNTVRGLPGILSAEGLRRFLFDSRSKQYEVTTKKVTAILCYINKKYSIQILHNRPYLSSHQKIWFSAHSSILRKESSSSATH